MTKDQPVQIWTAYNPDALDAQDRPRYTLFTTKEEASDYALAVGLIPSLNVELKSWTEYMIGVSNVEDRRGPQAELVSKFSVLVQNIDNKGLQVFHVYAQSIDEAIGNAIEQASHEWDDHPDAILALITFEGHVKVLRTEV